MSISMNNGDYQAVDISSGESGNSLPSLSGRDITIHIEDKQHHLPAWEFPGWGKVSSCKPNEEELKKVYAEISIDHPKLSEWMATAICGNDILSSCLYVSGIVATKAGKLAPIALAVVAGVLYLYRFIYGEVLNAIPLNGGSYNVLLNTTSKRAASVAASLAILSYMATGVVSGTSACYYLSSQIPTLPIVPATVGLLGFFAVLSLIGISESASVALIIYIAHNATLIALCVLSCFFVYENKFEILIENFQTDYPAVDIAGKMVDGNFFTAIFFGASAAMLGISGFESSSQFVEEQAVGVFDKTLRNMWWSVAIFNPLLSFLSLGVLPLYGPNGIIYFQNTVLAEVGRAVGGDMLYSIVAIDAFIVLSGAVLTAFVGFNGLIRRLSGDRVLPEFLLQTNSWRGTNHYIIIGYFLLSASLVWILHGDSTTLAGVYTFAFLGLMTLFAIGCMLLKFKRAEIPRTVDAPWWSCILGVSMVMFTYLGNLMGNPITLTYFALYFITVLGLVFLMFERTFVLRLSLYFLRRLFPSRVSGRRMDSSEDTNDEALPILRTGARGGKTMMKVIKDINQTPIFFFCKRPNLTTINKAILYVRNNEQTDTLVVVHCHDPSKDLEEPRGFPESRALFDHIYLKLKLNYLRVDAAFSPAVVEWMSREYKQPKNLMFIKQPDHDFQHTVASLRGVRVITG